MPDTGVISGQYGAVAVDMMQTYLTASSPNVERRIRQQKNGRDYLYFYTEKRIGDDGTRWVTERPISEKEYIAYLMESDLSMHSVRKTNYRFSCEGRRMEIDVYPFSAERAVLFIYGTSPEQAAIPSEIKILKDVTGDAAYKNRALAKSQTL